jgi:hypothetical protein
VAAVVRGAALTLVFSASLLATAKEPSHPITYDEPTLLRNYALSQCVARAYNDVAVVEDGKAAAGAYLEAGHVGPDVYGDIVKLVEAKLRENYPGKSGDQRQLMKCIDLYWARDLQRIVAKHARERPSRAR